MPTRLPFRSRRTCARRSRPAPGSLPTRQRAALGITLSIITGEIGQKRLTIQGYRVVSKVGRGGSSIVYLAERESDKQQVVLKILNATAGLDEICCSALCRNSTSSRRSITPTWSRSTTALSDRHAYIAMEYFPNGSLAEVIAQGLSGRQALSLLAQAASALREVHSRGVIHRDIKPGNLMARADGSIVLADFGIAKRLGEDKGRTLQGELYGPLLRFAGADRRQPRDDAVRYLRSWTHFLRMLTRRRPFDAESVSD